MIEVSPDPEIHCYCMASEKGAPMSFHRINCENRTAQIFVLVFAQKIFSCSDCCESKTLYDGTNDRIKSVKHMQQPYPVSTVMTTSPGSQLSSPATRGYPEPQEEDFSGCAARDLTENACAPVPQ